MSKSKKQVAEVEPVTWTEAEVAQAQAATAYHPGGATVEQQVSDAQAAGWSCAQYLDEMVGREQGAKAKAAESKPAPVNVFVDDALVPVSARAPVSGQPAPISVVLVEPSVEQQSKLSTLIGARQQARQEYQDMKWAYDNLTEAQLVFLGDALQPMKDKLAAKLGEIMALDAEIAAAQKSIAPSSGAVVAELVAESVPTLTDAEQAALGLWESSLKPRLLAGLVIAEQERTGLVALDKEHGQPLDALCVYYDNPGKIPLHYAGLGLKERVIIPAWETRQTIHIGLRGLSEAISEARDLIQRGWAPGPRQIAGEYRQEIEGAILALIRPEGLAKTLADQIAGITGHLAKLRVTAKARKAAIAADPSLAPVLITPQPITGKPKPAQDPSVVQAATQWDPFK